MLSDGRWIVEVRYDSLLHEGEGETAAAALVDAVLHILETLSPPQGSNLQAGCYKR